MHACFRSRSAVLPRWPFVLRPCTFSPVPVPVPYCIPSRRDRGGDSAQKRTEKARRIARGIRQTAMQKETGLADQVIADRIGNKFHRHAAPATQCAQSLVEPDFAEGRGTRRHMATPLAANSAGALVAGRSADGWQMAGKLPVAGAEVVWWTVLPWYTRWQGRRAHAGARGILQQHTRTCLQCAFGRTGAHR